MARDYITSPQGQKDISERLEKARNTTIRKTPYERFHQPMTL